MVSVRAISIGVVTAEARIWLSFVVTISGSEDTRLPSGGDIRIYLLLEKHLISYSTYSTQKVWGKSDQYLSLGSLLQEVKGP